MSNKSLTQKPAKYKGKHQLDLLEEKRAFVVIALTDKLTLVGKLVALNALAHYNSECGYSWASIPVVAKESGYRPTSTKSISPGFDEIEEVGAFKVVRNPPRKGSKKSATNRCCPIMPWFRDEYERLRLAGKVERESDPFADVRSDRDSDESQGSQPDQTGFTTVSDRAHNPIRQGRAPDEENRLKGTDRTEQTQTNESAHSAVGGSLGSIDDDPYWDFVPVELWEWTAHDFDPVVDLHGFDDDELDDEIDHFVDRHRGQRRNDWTPVWLEWMVTPKIHGSKRQPVTELEPVSDPIAADPPF